MATIIEECIGMKPGEEKTLITEHPLGGLELGRLVVQIAERRRREGRVGTVTLACYDSRKPEVVATCFHF